MALAAELRQAILDCYNNAETNPNFTAHIRVVRGNVEFKISVSIVNGNTDDINIWLRPRRRIT